MGSTRAARARPLSRGRRLMNRRTGIRRGTAALASLLALAALPAETHPPPAAVAATVAGGGTRPDTAVLGAKWGDDTTGEGKKASAETGVWDAKKDLGSLYSLTKSTGAQDAWTRKDAGGRWITGKGVTVALIDTGIALVPGLDGPGKVVNGPDLSFEGQAPGTRYVDGYGHGTHLAGIIAARDVGVAPGQERKGYGVVGAAPDARILNVKVGSGDGGVDVTQVVAAVDWVVQHRRDNGMNVRVINLSYGTHSRLSYTSDPLAGAVDNRGTAGAADDGVAGFSNVGSPDRHLNVVAPGKSVVSLRVPGSYADRGHPEGLVPGEVSGRLFRGSGSSQAAAVVSGAAALLLQQRPRLTPNQVKWILGRSARALPGAAGRTATYDVLDLTSALRTATPSSATAAQDAAATRGDGALDLARGDGRIVDPDNGVALAGDVDALGTPWNGAHWAAASTARASWTGGTWNARSWSGDGWTAPSWAGPAWDAAAWTGVSWSGADWASRRWSSDAWVSRRWSGEDWASRRWSGEDWASRRWSGEDWASRRWSGEDWASRRWSGDGWSSRRWSGDGWSSRRWRATTGSSAAAAGDAARRAR